jgi:hypothetical protein
VIFRIFNFVSSSLLMRSTIQTMVNKYKRDQKYSYNKIPAKQEEEKSTTDYELTLLSYVQIYHSNLQID